MKKIIFIALLFCGLAFTAQSQSLTYSKVILLTSLDTVPQGRVWKVTSYTANDNPSYNTTTWVRCKFNNIENNLSTMRMTGNSTYGYATTRETPFPIWLPAGTTVEPFTNCGSLSIIEFTENNE